MRGAVLALRARPLERMNEPIVVCGPPAANASPRAPSRGSQRSWPQSSAVTTVLSTQAAKGPARTARSSIPVASVPDDQDLKQLRTLRMLQLGGQAAARHRDRLVRCERRRAAATP